jgi:hypothetical protein
MKIHALSILVLLGLAACSTTYKGSIQGSSKGDEQKRESYLSSHSETSDHGLTVNQ